MKKQVSFFVFACVGFAMLAGPARFFETVFASGDTPLVFQAAGPTGASIQGTVQAFRDALGPPNNGTASGPLGAGHREITWDGGGAATTISPTPLDGFLVTRGARFTTTGSGFVQAPVEGLATTFDNPTYANIFKAFSPLRLFSPIDSKFTTTLFFVPGGGELPATVTGFGAVFSNVDRPETSISFYGVHGELLFSQNVPVSPGDASQSFLGVLFGDARIASVRITTGNTAPGPDDSVGRNVVMMDDFLYGEPQQIEVVDAARVRDLAKNQ